MGWLHLQARSQELGEDVSRQAEVHRELKWAVVGSSGQQGAGTGGARATPHHLDPATHVYFCPNGSSLTGICLRTSEPQNQQICSCGEHSVLNTQHNPLRQWVSYGLGMHLLRAAILNWSGFGTNHHPLMAVTQIKEDFQVFQIQIQF